MSNELQSKMIQLDKQISQLTRERNAIEDQWIAAFQEDAKAYVGKCYKDGHKYAKIISPPLRLLTMTAIRFNEYQFPAIFLTTDLIPIKYRTFYIGPHMKSWREIPAEEFDRVFKKRVLDLRGLMDHGVSCKVLEHHGEMHPYQDKDFWCNYNTEKSGDI